MVRPRFWVAYGALAVAMALLVPTLSPLSGSMDSFAKDLASGSFRPFGPKEGKAPLREYSGDLGGFTGSSEGNYLPGAADVPDQWVMDRDGRGGSVVIDAVFNPSLGAMKRLKAFDTIAEDGITLGVARTAVQRYAFDPTVRYDTPIEGSFQVQLRPGELIPIYSPHPRPLIRSFSTDPRVPGNVTFWLDGADTLYVRADSNITTTLNVSFMTAMPYYDLREEDVPRGASVDDYAFAVRPRVPASLVEDAKVVLARAGAGDGSDLGQTITALSDYFRSFTEGDIPPPSEVESLYLALALGGHGCCRHRAFAFMVTAQAVGIPTRVVVNEAHAFVEVMLPAGDWHQINLGGCGTYTVNNPNNYRDLLAGASDPRGEANPDEDRPRPSVVTFTNITESPSRIVKGERYVVNGTVETAGGRPAPGLRVDVFLNETKEAPGRLSGAGVTDANGRYSVVARVPKDLAARSYQLVARAQDPGAGNVRYIESWSDPEVDVFAPTKFLFPKIVAAAGFPVPVTGRLLDVDNNPVLGGAINWTLDGSAQGILVTDGTGRFQQDVTFPDVGRHTLSFSYSGGDHYGSAQQTVTVIVESGAILIPPDAPTLPRGEGSVLNGSLAVAGQAIGGRIVNVTLLSSNASGARVLASAEATTDARGSFLVPIEIDGRVPPGVYPVRYDVPTLGLNTTGLARVAIRPTLLLDAPRTVSPGEDWVLRATLVSDNGTAVAGGIVEVTIDGNRSNTRALLTNRTGVARFEFSERLIEPGPHSVLVAFPGDALHAEVSRATNVEVVRPWFATIPLWVYAAGAGVLVLVAAAAWLLRAGGPVVGAIARIGAARRDRRHIEVGFPDHPVGVAPVFEPGAKAALLFHLRHRDGRILAGRLLVETAGVRRRGRAPLEGWRVEVQAPDAGPLVVRASARGLSRLWTAPFEASFPVHSYREAVEAGFVAMRKSARLADSASPADLVRALGPKLPSATQSKLREAAALFEVADYSERSVDRAFYHAFALARRDLERALAKEAHAHDG